MTKKEAAALLGVTERTLAQWTAQNKIGVRYERGKNGDVAVYERGELERFKAGLKRPTHRPTAQRITPGVTDGPFASDSSTRDSSPGAPVTTGDIYDTDTGNFHPLLPLPDATQLDALARLLAAIGVTIRDGQPRPLAAPQDQASQVPPSQTQPSVPIADKLLLTLAEVQALTGLSRAVLRQAIQDGALKARQVGRTWRVTRLAVEAYVAALDMPDPSSQRASQSSPHADGKKAGGKAKGRKAGGKKERRQ